MKFGGFQNFKDRFLSRGSGPIEDFVLCAYGKLPIYKDYIQWECHQGAALHFKQWLDQAFGLAWDQYDGKNVRLRSPMRGLLLTPDGRSAVVASFWPSADEGNLRKFPFVLFACFPRGELVGRGVRGAVEGVGPLWRCFDEQYEQIQELGSIDALYSWLQRTNPKPEPAAADVENQLNLEFWMESFDSADPGAYRRQAENLVRQTLRAYRSFPEQGESLAACLPLAADHSDALQAEVWAEAFGANLKKIPAFPSILIDRTSLREPGTITLVWRPLQIEDSMLFGEFVDQYDHVEHLVPSREALAQSETEPLTSAKTVEEWVEALGSED